MGEETRKSYQEATIAIARVVSRQNWRLTLTRLRKPYQKSGDIQLVEKRQGGSFPKKDLLCRYVRMISPDITISNHFLRGAADGMRFTAPLPRKKLKVLHLFRCFTHTHTHTLERPHVAVAGGYFNSYEYNEKIPWNACCRDRHGWFLAWQPRRGKRTQSSYWKMEVLHFRTGTWILRPESISVTCNSLFVFVGLPLLQVRQSPCCETWKIEIRSKEHRHPLEKGLTHTH